MPKRAPAGIALHSAAGTGIGTSMTPEDGRAPAPLNAAFMARHPAAVLALTGGLGLIPLAPGTWGAVAGIPLGLYLATIPAIAAIAVLAAGFAVGVWACGVTARAAGVHDHQAIVFDETWAMALVVAFAPTGATAVLAGFLAFRLFDIAKPWPIGRIDRQVGGGFGIMLDDAVAALFALAAVAALARFGWL